MSERPCFRCCEVVMMLLLEPSFRLLLGDGADILTRVVGAVSSAETPEEIQAALRLVERLLIAGGITVNAEGLVSQSFGLSRIVDVLLTFERSGFAHVASFVEFDAAIFRGHIRRCAANTIPLCPASKEIKGRIDQLIQRNDVIVLRSSMIEGVSGRESFQPVPQRRIVEKLDDYMSRRDYAGAERHLHYWLDEALASGDKRGELMVRNELVGHFRKTGDRRQSFLHADAALRLVEELGFDNTISAGTTYTNVATAYNAFGENERSLECFGKAVALYESSPQTDPRLLGGLYNNKALACVSLGRFREADELYAKALSVMAGVENGELEQAITYLNMADAVTAQASAEKGIAEQGDVALQEDYASCEEAIEAYLDKALELLDTSSVPRDGYYAFVCEKCAPVFAYYGYFLAVEDLKGRAQAIYERA